MHLYLKNNNNNNDTHSSDEENHVVFKEETLILMNNDSDCSSLIQDHKDIKINVSDISKLMYNSMIAQYNN